VGASPECRRSVDCSVDQKEGFSGLSVPPTPLSSSVFQPPHLVLSEVSWRNLVNKVKDVIEGRRYAGLYLTSIDLLFDCLHWTL
ncbi:hypothetical protein VIGAN_06067500, partial [Vigna angularis var. angularis]